MGMKFPGQIREMLNTMITSVNANAKENSWTVHDHSGLDPSSQTRMKIQVRVQTLHKRKKTAGRNYKYKLIPHTHTPIRTLVHIHIHNLIAEAPPVGVVVVEAAVAVAVRSAGSRDRREALVWVLVPAGVMLRNQEEKGIGMIWMLRTKTKDKDFREEVGEEEGVEEEEFCIRKHISRTLMREIGEHRRGSIGIQVDM